MHVTWTKRRGRHNQYDMALLMCPISTPNLTHSLPMSFTWLLTKTQMSSLPEAASTMPAE